MSSVSDNRLDALGGRSIIETERSVVILGKKWVSIAIASGKYYPVNARNNLGCETKVTQNFQNYCRKLTVPLTSSICPFAKDDPAGRNLLISGMTVTF